MDIRIRKLSCVPTKGGFLLVKAAIYTGPPWKAFAATNDITIASYFPCPIP